MKYFFGRHTAISGEFLKRCAIAMVCAASLVLSGCASVQKSQPIAQGAFAKTLSVADKLPSNLPKKLSPIPGSSYVMFLPDSAATLLVPVPFVGDVAMAKLHEHEARRYADKFATVDPYDFALQVLQAKSYFAAGGGTFTLYPFVVVQHSIDDVYRASLVFQIEGNGWLGRYFYHLPTIYPADQFKDTPPEEIESLGRDLRLGTEKLVELIERDNAGDLVVSGKTATVGSLFIVGVRVAGLVSPTVLRFPKVPVVEEGEDHLIVRGSGNPKAEAQSGGFLFGVHYFHKDQLHTFSYTDGGSD